MIKIKRKSEITSALLKAEVIVLVYSASDTQYDYLRVTEDGYRVIRLENGLLVYKQDYKRLVDAKKAIVVNHF